MIAIILLILSIVLMIGSIYLLDYVPPTTDTILNRMHPFGWFLEALSTIPWLWKKPFLSRYKSAAWKKKLLASFLLVGAIICLYASAMAFKAGI